MGKINILCDCNIIHEDTVNHVKNKIVSKEDLSAMSKFHKMLSDTTRMKIIGSLYVSEMCVCDIACLLNVTKSVISHQLKKLKENNFIKSRKVGKEVFYSLKDEHVKQVFEICLEHVKENEYETQN